MSVAVLTDIGFVVYLEPIESHDKTNITYHCNKPINSMWCQSFWNNNNLHFKLKTTTRVLMSIDVCWRNYDVACYMQTLIRTGIFSNLNGTQLQLQEFFEQRYRLYD